MGYARYRQAFNDTVQRWGDKVWDGLGELLMTPISSAGLAGIAMAGLLAFSGCANQITAGTVVDKHYEPERKYTILVPHTTTIGKTTITTLKSQTCTDDEDWVITIEAKDRKGEWVQRDLEIDQVKYEQIKLGEYYGIEAD